jgi:transcriptional regulator with XRE-family HTH domain
MGIDLTTERFRDERQRLKLSHARIAEICGVAKTSVIAWEKGVKIPAEALAALVEAGTGFDYQYVITGVRWGQFGPQDAALAAMSGPERAKAALDRVLAVQERIGARFSPDQLQALIGYTFEHTPSVDSLESFVRAALALTGNQSSSFDGSQQNFHGKVGQAAGRDIVNKKE